MILDCEYVNIYVSDDNKLFTLTNGNIHYSVVDREGNVIVPYGKYSFIDGFAKSYARVKKDNKWGIINEKDKEVLPVIYDNIQNFFGINKVSTKVRKDGIETYVYFRDMNPALPYVGENRPFRVEYNPVHLNGESETWYAMTDGMYGDYPEEGFDGGYSFMGR